MQIAYRFKLILDTEQEQTMGSWLGMLRGVVNYSLADRIDSYNQGFIQGNFCSLRSQAEACPLTCSVNRSASMGEPWKNVTGMKSRCKPKKDPETGKYLKNNQSAKSALNKAISDASWYSLRIKTEHQAKKLGNWVVDVAAHHSSQECSQCHYVSPTNRDKEKFVCENCGHHEDADIDAAVVIADRARHKIGQPNLPLVRRKVTPKPESTGCKELSPGLLGEPRNLTRNRVSPELCRRERVTAYVQLSLFDTSTSLSIHDVSGESPPIPRSG